MTDTTPAVGQAVIDGFSGMSAQLLLIIPAALGLALLTWGAPKAVKFFKGLAK